MDVPQLIAGRFRIERKIGTGGMGTVYLATHLDLERPVAVKIIRREFAADADVSDRFLREARTMAKLRHPNAAMIFDAGNLPDGRHFIVMEFVEGETLSQALAREGRFSFTQSSRYRNADLRRSRRSTPARDHSSRPQTFKHPARQARCLCARFRRRESFGFVGGINCDTREHGFGPVDRNAAVHVARAVFGTTCRRAQRSLQSRCFVV